MFDHQALESIYYVFYGGVTVLDLIACCYLLFRRGNAFAPDLTTPVRLRRWTAAFFSALALSHLWYLPAYFLTSSDDVMLANHVAGLLDCLTAIPLLIVVLFVMLQDRRHPLWPVWVMMLPFAAGRAWCIASRSDALLPVLFVCFLAVFARHVGDAIAHAVNPLVQPAFFDPSPCAAGVRAQ